MSNDSLFVRALRGERVEWTPVWIMRQAGRYLPEYRAIRERTDFLGLCKTPELAAEVTIQPVDIIGVDAAILFSDILVIPEAMGMHLELIESKGPNFPDPIRSAADIDNLSTDILGRLQYVFDAIKLTQERLNDRVPLIGFSGAPWTLMCYMVEGKGSKNFDTVKSFCYQEPQQAHRLLDMLADCVIEYLNAKIAAGCDAVQIFDTWAGVLSPSDLDEFVLPYVAKICDGLNTNGAPVIYFPKGVPDTAKLASLNCNALGIDWTKDIAKAKAEAGGKVVQGNLDPCVLFASNDKIRTEVKRILDAVGTGGGHVFNLGHGILPTTPVENARYLVECVKELSSVNADRAQIA
ncbi:MAG: uroporphyrinogen decarboxylase [Pyrinomonadaceae bacterium]